MDKHTKKTPSLFRYPVLVAFGLFFIGLFVLDMATPDRAYSELENTTLTQRPRLTAVSADGLNNYFTSYTRYVKDQVFGRDQWISLQSAAETTLFQKTQSGGILLGREHMMFARHYSILKNEEKGMAKNLAAVQSLAQRYPGRVNLMLVPSASVVYPENVPAGAPQIDEKGILEGVAAQGEAYGRFIDVLPALTEHKGEYLYYRTDHHWTTRGAFYGANALLNALGKEPLKETGFTPESASTDFNGTLYSTSGIHWLAPDTIEYWVFEDDLRVTSWKSGKEEPGRLYDRSYLEHKDKYSSFLGGNQPLCVLENPAITDGSKLLLIRDSYSDSLAPFLAQRFSEVHLLDLRYYHASVADYMAEQGIDTAVVLYSVSNFLADRNLIYLAPRG